MDGPALRPADLKILVMKFPTYGTIHPGIVNDYRDIQPKGIIAAMFTNLLLLWRFKFFIWKFKVHLVNV